MLHLSLVAVTIIPVHGTVVTFFLYIIIFIQQHVKIKIQYIFIFKGNNLIF